MTVAGPTIHELAHPRPRTAVGGLLRLYLQLTKARLSALVLLTTAVGFLLASAGPLDWMRLFWTILGTGLAAGSANALNQVLEIRRDGLMRRTCGRPLPSGAMSVSHGFLIGILLGYAGVMLLGAFVNLFAAALTLANIIAYVFIYTPLKPRTTLNTVAGAVCGAVPPVIGWVGAAGRIDTGAWVLAAILFLWQIPHFFALAWLYREDYARGGFRMLPLIDPTGRITCQVAVLSALALVPITLVCSLIGMTGWLYACTALALGIGFVIVAVRLHQQRTTLSARRLFLASLAYLSILLSMMVADRSPATRSTVIVSDAAIVAVPVADRR